jgi:hypothetical protein
VSRSQMLLYGLLGCLGLVLISFPQMIRFMLFDGEFGAIVHDVLNIVSSIGYYGMLIFSILLIIEAVQSLRRMYKR